ncbi:MAG: hypothetical protein QMD09_07930 [Desulfatibacillaceae bacterium]|nr:hypothetical protein [Desulfatibacillaceae bacterium]
MKESKNKPGSLLSNPPQKNSQPDALASQKPFAPRFEIRTQDLAGNEQIKIYSIAKFGSRFEKVSMERRGFLKLSLCAQAAAIALAGLGPVGKAFAQTGQDWEVLTGKLILADYGSSVACMEATGTGERVCMKIIPVKDRHDREVRQFGREIQVDDTVVFVRPKKGFAERFPVATAGTVTDILPDQIKICVKRTIRGQDFCLGVVEPTGANPLVLQNALAELSVGSPAFFFTDFTLAPNEDLPVSLRVVYLKSGGVIECRESWISDSMLHYRLGFGTMAIALNKVDLERSFRHSVQVEVEEVVARHAAEIARRSERRAREEAQKAREALDEWQKSRAGEDPAAARTAPKTSGPAREKVYKKADEVDECDVTTETCSCVPVCY